MFSCFFVRSFAFSFVVLLVIFQFIEFSLLICFTIRPVLSVTISLVSDKLNTASALVPLQTDVQLLFIETTMTTTFLYSAIMLASTV
jgi:hypothetical protein